MTPIIIADSDDEDETFSPTRPLTTTTRALVEETTHALEDGSHHTTSTDASFFQIIYDEQNGAFQEIFNEELPESIRRDVITSSEVTAPAPFQRIVTGLIDPSSLTSVSDPRNGVDTRTSSGNGAKDWTQVSTPGRKKAPTAVMDDPWDVPSSPEAGQVRIASKIRLKRGEALPISNRLAKHPTGTHQTKNPPIREVEVHHEGLELNEIDLAGGRKRRRIEHSRPTQSSLDDVDLVTIPFSNDHGDELLSMLPPTLPMDHNPSFYAPTRPFTSTPMMEYQNVQLPFTGGQPENFLPPIYQQDLQMMGFSGTPTNVNTPRSDGVGFSTAPLPSNIAESKMEKELVGQPTSQQYNSSPDIISVAEPPIKPKPTRQRGRQKRNKPDRPMRDEVLSKEVLTEDLGSKEVQSSTMDPEANDKDSVEQPVKPRKGRGRPRKKDGEGAIQKPKEPPISNPEDGEATARQKKKRGRPKKQDKLVTADESPQATTNTSGKFETADVETAQPLSKSKVSKEERDITHEKVVEKFGELTPTVETKGELESSILKETSQNSVMPKTVDVTEEEVKDEDPDIAETKKEEKPSTPAAKSTGQAKGLSALISKPMYRVGLSKRSRIAPLLKSLRK